MMPVGVQGTYSALPVDIFAAGVLFTYIEEFESIGIGDNGYQIQLPDCREAGFEVGDTAPIRSGEGVLVLYDDNSRLADDLLTFRGEQVSRQY